MAGAMGVAASAGAVFKKIIDSSQTSADGFQVIIGVENAPTQRVRLSFC